MAAVQPFGFECLAYIATEAVVSHPAQPAHPKAQARESNGHVGVSTSNLPLEFLNLGQLAAGLGHKHGHGLAEREDFGTGSSRMGHGESPRFGIGSSSHAMMS